MFIVFEHRDSRRRQDIGLFDIEDDGFDSDLDRLPFGVLCIGSSFNLQCIWSGSQITIRHFDAENWSSKRATAREAVTAGLIPNGVGPGRRQGSRQREHNVQLRGTGARVFDEEFNARGLTRSNQNNIGLTFWQGEVNIVFNKLNAAVFEDQCVTLNVANFESQWVFTCANASLVLEGVIANQSIVIEFQIVVVKGL